MKKIEAIIKPFKLDELKDTLEDIGIENIIITDVRLFGQKNEKSSMYEGGEYIIDSLPKTKLEFFVAEKQIESVIEQISIILNTGRNGDGYISIYSIDEIIHISSGS